MNQGNEEMKAPRSGQSQGAWLHEISIHNEGSRTKKNESRPKTKDSKIWFQDPKPKPKSLTKIQEQGPRVKAKTQGTKIQGRRTMSQRPK